MITTCVGKWKNVCYIRILHVTLSLFVAATLVFINNSSELHQRIWMINGPADIAYFVSYAVLLLLSLLFYCLTFLTDPGFVPLQSFKVESTEIDHLEDEDDRVEETDVMIAPSSGIKLRHCTSCNIQQPLRSHHCEECKRCVRKFDHHCPWFEKCIGEGNHHYFLLFVFLKTPLVLWSAVIAWRAMQSHTDWIQWLEANTLYVIDLFILLPAGFSLVCLFFMHSYVAVTNTTTWEMMSRERITYLKHLDDDKNPFHLGYFKNIWHFLCRKTAIRWEAVYGKSTKDIDSEVV